MWPLTVLICIWNFLSANKLTVFLFCRVIYCQCLILWIPNLPAGKDGLQYLTSPRAPIYIGYIYIYIQYIYIFSNAHIKFFQNKWWARNILQRSKPGTTESNGQNKIQAVTWAKLYFQCLGQEIPIISVIWSLSWIDD